MTLQTFRLPCAPLLAATALLCTALPGHTTGIDLTVLPGISTSASSCYLGCGNPSHDKDSILDNQRLLTGLDNWNSGSYGGWVQVDFGAAYAIERVELYGGYPYGNAFTLSASVDGLSFAAIGSDSYHLEPALSLGPTGNWASQKFGAVFTYAGGAEPLARYLRYTRTGGPDWGYLYEIEATGNLAAVPEPQTWVLMAAGMAALASLALRRGRT